MNNLQMKHEIVGQYPVSFETFQDEEDNYFYVVRYGDEIRKCEDLQQALNFYDGCLEHQRACSGLEDFI